jgi:hypothetical protein
MGFSCIRTKSGIAYIEDGRGGINIVITGSTKKLRMKREGLSKILMVLLTIPNPALF